MPFKSKANRTTFKVGHIRSFNSISKQIQTMKEQYRLGKREHPLKPKGIKDIYGESVCAACNLIFTPNSGRQKWCSVCVPNKMARTIMGRYNITHSQYLSMIEINKNCPICFKKLINPVIDHCHKTGKVRGMICNRCNLALSLIEDSESLQRALNYLK